MTPYLHEEPCMTAQPGDTPMSMADAEILLRQLNQWTLHENGRISRQWNFPDFTSALAFVNRVGDLAEDVGHHPDISLGWGRASIELSTHDIGGLHRADFVLAARIDQI